MYKGLKTVIQVLAIWSPVLYWNFNVDTVTNTQVITAFAVGGTIALLTEWLYRFIKYIKS